VPTVGIGGSAGSLSALIEIFKVMPPDCGMAFVVVVHLLPHSSSVLAELIQRHTRMRVISVCRTEIVAADHVYVIPPGKPLAVNGQHLRLADLLSSPRQHVVIDRFFRSLGDTYKARAAAVVLSGADADGASGIRRIKARGGRPQTGADNAFSPAQTATMTALTGTLSAPGRYSSADTTGAPITPSTNAPAANQAAPKTSQRRM
jgi:chemotaxis response regulator CheB